MKRLLLTGAGGFFNSRVYNCHKNCYDILPLGRRDLDITDREAVHRCFKEFKPEYVIHAAAISSTGGCSDNKELAYRVNTEGCANIAEASKEVGAKMIYCSTEQIFNGNIESGPYNEKTVPCPNTVYGVTKLEGEKRILGILDDAVILRFTWLFSFPERNMKVNSNILWNVLSSIFKNEPIKLPSHEFRGHTYVYEIVEQIPKIFDLPGGIYHTGSMNNESTYDVAAYILKAMGLSHRLQDLIIKDDERYKENPRDLRIDNSKLKSFGVKFHDTTDAIERVITEFGYKF